MNLPRDDRLPPRGPKELVTIVTGLYPPDVGGVADHCHLLATELVGRGVNVEVLHAPLCEANSADAEQDGSVPVRRTRFGWSLGGARQLANELATRPRVIIFQYVPHMYGRAGLAPGAAVFPAQCRRRGLRVISHIHEASVPLSVRPFHLAQALIHRVQARMVVRSSNGIVFSSTRTARQMKWWLRMVRHPWRVIGSGPTVPVIQLSDSERFDVKGRWVRGSKVLVVVYGLASRGKRYDLALEALASLRGEGLLARLLMLGDQEAGDAKYCQEIREAARDMGLGSAVTWSGPLPAGEISEILASADCMWNLEAGGLTARNATAACAFALGLPVVAFRGRILDSCFRAGENVLLVGGSGEEIAAATRRLLSTPELAASLSREGKRLYEASFSWDVIARGYLELLAQIGVESA